MQRLAALADRLTIEHAQRDGVLDADERPTNPSRSIDMADRYGWIRGALLLERDEEAAAIRAASEPARAPDALRSHEAREVSRTSVVALHEEVIRNAGLSAEETERLLDVVHRQLAPEPSVHEVGGAR